MDKLINLYDICPTTFAAILGISFPPIFLFRKYAIRRNLGAAIRYLYKDNPGLKVMRTTDSLISERGMPFIVKQLCSEDMQPDAKYRSNWNKTSVSSANNPFAPPFIHQEVVLTDFTPKHRLLFNKFPLLPNHLLIVTKKFEKQVQKLDRQDLQAAIIVMEAMGDGVIYMNAGKNSGASQPHKHLQCLPESEFKLTEGQLPLSIAIREHIPEFFSGRVCSPVKLECFEFAHEIYKFSDNLIGLAKQQRLDRAVDIAFKCYEGRHSKIHQM